MYGLICHGSAEFLADEDLGFVKLDARHRYVVVAYSVTLGYDTDSGFTQGGGFFLATRILGEASAIHSPPALFLFVF